MLWKITTYNGNVWEAPYQMDLVQALEMFYSETKSVQWDVKKIENLH